VVLVFEDPLDDDDDLVEVDGGRGVFLLIVSDKARLDRLKFYLLIYFLFVKRFLRNVTFNKNCTMMIFM